MYTTHGYMTHADYQEYMEDTDQHSITVEPDDPPLWFDVQGRCPCGLEIIAHESVTVQAASGEIWMCSEGWREEEER